MANDWLDLSKQAFEASTTYLDANYRPDLDYSLRAFRNEHAAGSKYNSEEYKARSRIFRPKTRSIIRKNEAAAMQAAFSNREMVNTEAGNPNDVMAVANAMALKELMEYRLHHSIPTFETYLGGVQDAQTSGAVCSYQYWDYKQKGEKKIADKPCIELRPLENIRLDTGASWIDPVNTSPYWCDIIPMYTCDVRAMMKNDNDKTKEPKWKSFDDSTIALATPDAMKVAQDVRLGHKQDPHREDAKIKAFDVVWVMRWFMRDSQGEDYTYYTLGTEKLLSDAKPIDEVYFHGHRPYVMGYAILETHKVLKSSLPVMVRPLQQESNDVGNQRLDNVKFVLNKRWLVARGRQVDVQSLVRNVPGGVTLTTDPKNDVQESNWPDVTSSSFVEHDRLNAEFDDLAGNFSPSTKVANNAVNDTLGGSKMAAAGAGLMSEYMIRTINETWWTKVLRQLALLEQYYETDEVILSICAEKAQLFQRFGISRITDLMLVNEVTVSVDMAMGDPNQRLQKFLMATNAATQIRLNPAPGANVKAQTDEIYANAGYRDSARFFSDKQDPMLLKAMQTIQQLHQAVEGKQMELQAGLQETQMKLQSNEKIKQLEIQVDGGRIAGDLEIRKSELAVEQARIELDTLRFQLERQIAAAEHSIKMQELDASNQEALMSLEEARMKLEGEREKSNALSVQIAADIETAQLKLEEARSDAKPKMDGISSQVESLTKHVSQVKEALSAVEGIKGDVQLINKGLGALAAVVLMPKKKAKGVSLKKADGKKTSAVHVEYDDGSVEELSVN